MVKHIITFSVFLILLALSQTQFYSSVAVMEILLETQHRLIKHMENYVRYITDRKKALIVQKFLSRCKREDQLASWNRAHYLGNPINAFTLIFRLTRDTNYIEKILNETTAGMKYKPDNSPFYPNEEDVEGVVHGISRLQQLYDLDVSRMANGTLTTTFSTKKTAFIEHVTPMTACDCYELGLVEYEAGDRSRNIAWIKEALRRFEYDADCPINKVALYDRLSGDCFFMGYYVQAVHWIEKRIDASPGDPRNDQYRQSIKQLKGMYTTTNNLQKKPKYKDYDSFPAMCLKPYYSPNASLTCYYAHGPHPFLLLAPMKAERLHLSPPILMFYDVITDDEILAIKTLATPRFEKAKGTARVGTNSVNICIHQVAWLQDEWSQATLRVRRRIAQFSGLHLNNGTEDFQVANYGTGGYYGAHYDFIHSNASSTVTGTTLATALVYLADVEEGGATVFMKLGLTVFPARKAAMFWWNLGPTGHGDYSMLHAVCPMLRGSRWVLTKWISSAGQELIRPCPASAASSRTGAEVAKYTGHL